MTTLTAQQVRDTIEQGGYGDSFTQKLKNVAERVCVSERTLWDWQQNGSKKSGGSRLLIQLAAQCGIVEQPEGSVFIL